MHPAHAFPAVPDSAALGLPTATAIVSEREHLITYADPLFRRWTDDPDPVGRTASDVFRDVFGLPDLSGAVQACLSSGETFHLRSPVPARFSSADDDVHVQLTFAPLPRDGPDGDRPIVIVVADCTEQVAVQRQLERRAARERVLLRLATASNQASSTEEKLVALANSAVPELSDVCAVNLLNHPLPAGRPPTRPITTWRVAAPTSKGQIGPVPGRAALWSDGDPASAAVAAGRTVVVLYDPTQPPHWAAPAGVDRAIRDGKVHCTAMVPVAIDGDVHALIAFGAGPHRAAYGEDDVELFELIAAQTAVAMHQGGRYDTARSTALTLQRAMLTPPPPIDHLDLAVRYRPAGEKAEVGGDWYDVFSLTEHDLAFVVGDVAGHDMAAAAVMGQVRSMLRGFAITAPGPPHDTLTALDHAVRRLHLTELATCVYVQIRRGADETADETAGLHLTWSNAGHPAPVTVDRHGATSALENPRDAALGVSDGQFRTSGTHRLPSGSTLLLLTDGLYERRGLDLDECFSRLRATISESAHLPLDDMCDELLRCASHDDDIALIALRARPRAHP